MATADCSGDLNIAKELAAMRRMKTGELQAKYAEVFGERPRSRNRAYLIRRIAWRMQANAEGGLSERALERARELADAADLRLTAPKKVKPKALPAKSAVRLRRNGDDRLPDVNQQLKRTYKGRNYTVTVKHRGFEYEGEIYPSLSAVAKAITGFHWNGYYFFGLKGGAQ